MLKVPEFLSEYDGTQARHVSLLLAFLTTAAASTGGLKSTHYLLTLMH